MDKIKKAINRLAVKERKKIKEILIQIDAGDFKDLDLKKLKGRNDIFRVRKGDIRIIFYSGQCTARYMECSIPYKKDDSIKILSIERRSSKTYRKR